MPIAPDIEYDVIFQLHPELAVELTRRGANTKAIYEMCQVLHGLPCGQEARQCLTEHGWLMERALASVSFSERDGFALLNAVNGWFIGLPSDVMSLPDDVAEFLSDSDGQETLGMSAQDGIDLAAKLQAMSPAQLLAVVDASKRALKLCGVSGSGLNSAQALRAVHLVKEDKS